MSGLSITFEKVSKRLSPHFCIQGINLVINPGEFICVLGPSGCGKSTLLGLAGGWLRPDIGRVLFGGEDVTDLPAYRRPVRTCFQKGGFLFPHLTVAENVAYALHVKGVARSQALDHAIALLAQVGLAGFAKRKPLELSGGETQRVSVARALADPQPVLLLDEMTAGLDRPLRSSICDLVSTLVRKTDVTTIYVTHDVEEAFAMTARFQSRIAIINDGKIVQVASALDIYRKPVSRFVASLVGDTNLLPVVALDSDAAKTAGGNWLQLPPKTTQNVKYLALRPESLRFDKPEEGRSVALTGKVESVEFAGVLTKLTVRCLNDVFLTTASNHTATPKVGAPCTLYVAASDVCTLQD
jgi:ABC-type Fe3+/spermidine/putrescine transport system ATPase subunit